MRQRSGATTLIATTSTTTTTTTTTSPTPSSPNATATSTAATNHFINTYRPSSSSVSPSGGGSNNNNPHPVVSSGAHRTIRAKTAPPAPNAKSSVDELDTTPDALSSRQRQIDSKKFLRKDGPIPTPRRGLVLRKESPYV